MSHPYRPDPAESPRDRLIGALEFTFRVINHSAHLDEKDTTELARNIVEKLDAYLDSNRQPRAQP